MFEAAATNQMATNAAVAMVVDEVLVLARSFAIPRQTAQSTKPPRMMIMVRIAPSFGYELVMGEVLAET
jgi:hypothetical protein